MESREPGIPECGKPGNMEIRNVGNQGPESFVDWSNLVPRASFPLTSGRKTRALGATIACHRCSQRLRSEPDNQNPVIFYCYFKTDAPRALVFPSLVKGNEALGTRLGLVERLPPNTGHAYN